MRLNRSGFVRGGALVLVIAFLNSGCVAFNVGKPETFTHTKRIAETSLTPIHGEVLSADAQLQKRGAETVVGLGLDITEDYEKREHTETTAVRKQKRLSVGLFPWMAESLLMPNDALHANIFSAKVFLDHGSPPRYLYQGNPDSNIGHYVIFQVATLGFFSAWGTIYSCFIVPFDNWECKHDLFDPEYVVYDGKNEFGIGYYDASISPKLHALAAFPSQTRDAIGINTCFTHEKTPDSITHMGLFGFHKHLAVFVDGPTKGPSTVIGTETKRRSAFASGPFIAELSIPALNHNDWKRVSARDTQAVFALPAVERDCTVEAVVSFREDNSVNGRNASDLTRQALAKVAGRQWKFDVALKGSGRAESGGHRRPDPVQLPRPPEKLFDVVTIKPMGEGQYLVRIEVKDKSKTFDILHIIRPEVYRLVRDDFRQKNPDVSAQFVRESMRYETERDGKILSFTGWVFSVRPEEDGWRYDDETRRGWIRLRVTGGIPAAEAERWAHENIGEIVKYKNVAIEVGKEPPPGATFRSLGESFDNGVLTVEFEAIQ